MFDHQVPHIAWLVVVGIFSLLGVAAIIDISYLYGFHIFLSKYTSNTFILLSVGSVSTQVTLLFYCLLVW